MTTTLPHQPAKLKPNFYCHAEPHEWDEPHAHALCLSEKARADLASIPSDEEHMTQGIIAFDRITRRYYAIRHFPCFVDSFDCCCAAQAKPVAGPDAEVVWEPVKLVDVDDYCPCCGEPKELCGHWGT